VGAVVTSIILTAVAVSIMGVQGSYQSESRIMVAVDGMRTATSFIEQRLRMAGYGVDPRFAFDFGTAVLPSNNKANHVISLGTGVPTAITDDLAFRYRDAAYLRRGRFMGAAGLQLESGTFGVDLHKGQRLIVSCNNGKKYLVLRVNTGGVSQNLGASSNFTVDPALSSITPDETCLTKAGALDAPYIMLMHEVRLRIKLAQGGDARTLAQGMDGVEMAEMR